MYCKTHPNFTRDMIPFSNPMVLDSEIASGDRSDAVEILPGLL
jgi:hypothetical protein